MTMEFSKKGFYHTYFPIKFEKIVKSVILQNNCKEATFKLSSKRFISSQRSLRTIYYVLFKEQICLKHGNGMSSRSREPEQNERNNDTCECETEVEVR